MTKSNTQAANTKTSAPTPSPTPSTPTTSASTIVTPSTTAASLSPPAHTSTLARSAASSEKLQALLLHAQAIHHPSYTPSPTILSALANPPAHLDGTIGNLFTDHSSSLVCNSCVTKMCVQDRGLWDDLKSNVHGIVPEGMGGGNKVGGDVGLDFGNGMGMEVCFCGYFSFGMGEVERHVEGMEVRFGVEGMRVGSGVGAEGREDVIEGLVGRIEGVKGLHRRCRARVIGVVSGMGWDCA